MILPLNSVARALTAPLVACLFVVVSGCPGPPSSDLVAITDFELKLPDRDGPSGCDQSVKPEDVGCTTVCKPCQTSICLDGEWVPDNVEMPKEICDPPDLPENRPFGCPRTGHGLLPSRMSHLLLIGLTSDRRGNTSTVFNVGSSVKVPGTEDPQTVVTTPSLPFGPTAG